MRYPYEYEHAYKQAKFRLEMLYDHFGSYQKVADYLGVYKSAVYQILKQNWKPVSGKVCEILSLPIIEQVSTLVCPHCRKPQVAIYCKCKPETSPILEKTDKPIRIRVDIDPDIDEETLDKIRDLSKEARTNILKLLAG